MRARLSSSNKEILFMKILHITTVCAAILLLAGCVTGNVASTSTVLERSRGYGDESPSWISRTRKVNIDGDKVGFVGHLTMPADDSTLDRCGEMAALDAKGKLASSI